jgi:murein DD-endopeptidase MepM/ murein hydrolase activator NlpD
VSVPPVTPPVPAAADPGAGPGLRAAAEAFESLFIESLIARMSRAQLEGGFFGDGPGTELYDGLFMRHLAEHLAAGSPLGIARLLEEQWSRQGDGAAQAADALAAVGALRARESYEAVAGLGTPPAPGHAPAPSDAPAVVPPRAGVEPISRGYGWGADPIDGRRRFHRGVDLPAPTGTPVLALADGQVQQVERGRGYGLQVVVEHANGWTTRYAHLSAADVRPGDRVIRGHRLGRVGSSGRSTGPHLHFEAARGGRPADPALTVRGPLRPQVLGPAADAHGWRRQGSGGPTGAGPELRGR